MDKPICLICEKEVEQEDIMPNGGAYSINGAVLGRYTKIYGHRTCIDNVNRLVVLESRSRLVSLLEEIRKQFRLVEDGVLDFINQKLHQTDLGT